MPFYTMLIHLLHDLCGFAIYLLVSTCTTVTVIIKGGSAICININNNGYLQELFLQITHSPVIIKNSLKKKNYLIKNCTRCKAMIVI